MAPDPEEHEWAIFCLDNGLYHQTDLERFGKKVHDIGRRYGVHLRPSPTAVVCVDVENAQEVDNIFENLYRKTTVRLVIVAIPHRHMYMETAQLYEAVESSCEMRSITVHCFNAWKIATHYNIRSDSEAFFRDFCTKLLVKL